MKTYNQLNKSLASLLFLILIFSSLFLLIPPVSAQEEELKEAPSWMFMFSDSHMFEAGREYHMYPQTWVAIAAIIFAFIMAISTFIAYKKTEFKLFKYLPLVFLILAISFIPIAYHTAYCEECASLGACGQVHNYGTIVALIAIALATVFAVKSFGAEIKGPMMRSLLYGTIAGVFAILLVVFIGSQLMGTPGEMEYPPTVFNPEGFVFVAIILVGLYFSIKLFLLYRKTKAGFILPLSLGFLVVALSQILAAKHIFTCYWCHIMECSEWFTLSGICLLIAIMIFYHSFKPFIDELK